MTCSAKPTILTTYLQTEDAVGHSNQTQARRRRRTTKSKAAPSAARDDRDPSGPAKKARSARGRQGHPGSCPRSRRGQRTNHPTGPKTGDCSGSRRHTSTRSKRERRRTPGAQRKGAGVDEVAQGRFRVVGRQGLWGAADGDQIFGPHAARSRPLRTRPTPSPVDRAGRGRASRPRQHRDRPSSPAPRTRRTRAAMGRSQEVGPRA